MYTLRVTPTMINEWSLRYVADSIPALDTIYKAGLISVSEETVKDIIRDCEFMLVMNGSDLSPSECKAYKEMLRQCKLALSIGPVEAAA